MMINLHPLLFGKILFLCCEKEGNVMEIDITPLKDALATLNEVLVEYDKDRNNSFVRDSYVKRFEYTYELSIRILRRFLLKTEANISKDDLISYKKLVRIGLARGLLKSSVEKWVEYRDARNLTSHTYEIKNAENVIAVAADLAEEVKEYIGELERRIAREHENG
jgi:nucleotidyltransferase substrate binding protein (TIGR01987 family)